MNKKNLFYVFAIMMVAMLSVGFVSCGGDDDDDIVNPDTGNGGGANNNKVVVGSAVDLGLSVKFADRNVGAKNTEDLGDLYAWAETETKNEFSLDNYFDRDFTIVTSNICGTEYDVATTKWGSPWRMMTWSEVEEIRRKCTLETITQNGVKGMRITGPTETLSLCRTAMNKLAFAKSGFGQEQL